jgi:mRNA-degrading endonuclease toxin of MazEF toxin-antitoxin module
LAVDKVRISHGGLYAATLDPRFGTERGKERPVLVIQTTS